MKIVFFSHTLETVETRADPDLELFLSRSLLPPRHFQMAAMAAWFSYRRFSSRRCICLARTFVGNRKNLSRQ